MEVVYAKRSIVYALLFLVLPVLALQLPGRVAQPPGSEGPFLARLPRFRDSWLWVAWSSTRRELRELFQRSLDPPEGSPYSSVKLNAPAVMERDWAELLGGHRVQVSPVSRRVPA